MNTLAVFLAMFQTGNLFAWSLQQAPVMTRWAEQVDPYNTLPEYPRPQMVREDWMNLNGIWEFQPAAESDPVPTGQTLTDDILVPFPVESAISGVMQHYDRLWYRRQFDIPTEWDGQRIVLNFGAVDWESEVYINGTSAGVHKGGYDSFSYDITPYLNASGPQELIVRIFDPTNNQGIARGKQDLNPGGIWYTAVTGIWQTVWLEPVPEISIEEVKLVPDVDNKLLNVTGFVSETVPNLTVQATAYDNGVAVGTVSGAVGDELQLVMHNPKLWTPETPFLYDLTVVLKQGTTVIDQVDSYFGMRKVALHMIEGINRLTLNDEFIFQIGPLDQGWWPDGLYTAPTDEALKWDIDMIKTFGFNMVRKHVKIEPARWYYWCDKLGVMVWQDMPSVRSGASAADRQQFEIELSEMVREFGSHPSIILWVVFNEGWGQYDTVRLTEDVMEMDPSRLVTCASGWTDYNVGHVIDIHSYPAPGSPTPTATRAAVNGEFGGIGMQVDGHMWDENSWGYTMVGSGEELAALYDSFIQQLIGYKDNPGLSAAVYTQITDVEVEINGLITYDRDVVKADPNLIYISNSLYTRTYEEVLATSEQTAQTWRYTTATPPADWYTETFDDASWDEGPGGFGTDGTPGAIIGTEWDTSDIWLRRTFNPGSLTTEDIEKLVLRIHHDEDSEVYINGVPASSTTGYTTGYIHLPVNAAGKAALIPDASNVMAVHCHQTNGGQYIDVGLALESIDGSVNHCGQWGYAPADLDRNCQVNIEDLAIFSADWLSCSVPDQVNCVNYVLP